MLGRFPASLRMIRTGLRRFDRNHPVVNFQNFKSLLILILLAFSHASTAQTPSAWVIYYGESSNGHYPTWNGEETTWKAAAQDFLDNSQVCIGRHPGECGPVVLINCGP